MTTTNLKYITLNSANWLLHINKKLFRHFFSTLISIENFNLAEKNVKNYYWKKKLDIQNSEFDVYGEQNKAKFYFELTSVKSGARILK